MPIVKMHWGPHERPTVAPSSLVEFLRTEAGMHAAEAQDSAEDLIRGKTVEAYFDLGENEAARAFSQNLNAWGLEAKIQSDKEIETGDRINRVSGWVGPAVFLGIALIGAIVKEPWYGVVLLVVALGGVVCFFLIRSMNRRN